MTEGEGGWQLCYVTLRCIAKGPFINANLVILAAPVRIIGPQMVCLGHLGGFVSHLDKLDISC